MRSENEEIFISVDTLKECSVFELKEVIVETKKRIRNLIDSSLMGNEVVVQYPHRLRGLKKLVARCMTILRVK